MRGLAESAAELAAEVGGREVGGAGERGDVERLAVAGIDEILRAEEMANRVSRLHGSKYSLEAGSGAAASAVCFRDRRVTSFGRRAALIVISDSARTVASGLDGRKEET